MVDELEPELGLEMKVLAVVVVAAAAVKEEEGEEVVATEFTDPSLTLNVGGGGCLLRVALNCSSNSGQLRLSSGSQLFSLCKYT